jgi:G:T-mismatch repair DNA endonuclease (very short patch repair protein)
VFRGSVAVAAGTVTVGELRGPAFQRLFRDVYACADLDVTHSVRAVAAARLLVPGAVVTGWSALAVWGLPPDEEDDVELTVPIGSAVRRLPGLRIRRRALYPASVTERQGVRATTVEATAVDLARTGPLDEAVVLVDRLVDRRLTSLALVREVAAHASGRGCRQVRGAVALADGLAGSPQETRLRLLLHRSGLPRPVAQFVVRDADGYVGRVDFAWPDARVVVEYEGRWHGDTPQQVAKDRRRLNRLSAADWTIVFVTADDLRRPAAVLSRIAAALGASQSAECRAAVAIRGE